MSSSSQPAADRALSSAREGWSERCAAIFCDYSDLIALAVVTLGFFWRLWLAHATFFNTDEAWHFSVANQHSLGAAYRASLTLAHPPLLVVLLYFWRNLGASDVMLRLPDVIAGTIFCWIFYKWLSKIFGQTVAWVGLIFATFLPTLIALTAELRQYSFLLMFCVSAAYLLERALETDSAAKMFWSSVCLWLAMLSHYSAFLFAASLGVYAILRILSRRSAAGVIAAWAAGQAVGVALAGFLYTTHIAKLGAVYPVAQPLQRFADFYLADWYFHAGRDHLLPFLYRGSFGIFRFTFGQTGIGQIAALLYLAGVILLLRAKNSAPTREPSPRLTAVLLAVPFVLNGIAVAAGLYPYGRTRQCVFLAIFGLAGVSVAVARIVKSRTVVAVALALTIAIACQVFGTLQGRDMLPLAEQRHEHMDEALQFIHAQVMPADVIFTDKSTSYQLGHYLCRQMPITIERSAAGLEWFRCDGLQVVSTGPNDGALTPESVAARWQNAGAQANAHGDGLNSAQQVWIVQAGWAHGLAEDLRGQLPALAQLEPHAFGRYIEVFKLPAPPASPPAPAQP